MKNYPTSSTTHGQERRSLKAFNQGIPEELFIVRSEREDDYGVDVGLELMFGTSVTNIRSQVQLKSDTDGKRNKDGSYSFSVPIKTLNYLMNQPNSLFVIYVENEQILHWEWVTMIVQLANSQGIDVKTTDQKTIAYRFTNILNQESIREIHSTMLKNGQLVREFTEVTSFAVPGPVKATIDLEQGKIRTSENCALLIKQYGIWLANEGRYSDVQLLEDGLTHQTRTNPEVSVVLSYAKFHSGDYYGALAQVPKGPQLNTLPESLKGMAAYLRVHLNKILGMTDDVQYKALLAEIEDAFPGSILSLQTKMYRLREQFYGADRTKVDEYAELMSELKVAFRELKSQSHANPELRIRIEIFEWEIEGFNMLTDCLMNFSHVRAREKTGFPIPHRERLEMARKTVSANLEWQKQFSEMEHKGWPSYGIAVFAYLSYAQLQLQMIANFRALGLGNGEQDAQFVAAIRVRLTEFVQVLEANGDWHQLLRVKLALAETEAGLGNIEGAIQMATEVREFAETYGASDIVQRAERIIGGKTIFAIRKITDEKKTTDENLIELTDGEVPMYARQAAQLLGIPADRVTNVEIEYRWLRSDALDRKTHCKHLHVIQDLRHAQRLDTHYSVNPDRKYICQFLGHQSPTGGTDREAMISQFKGRFCLECSHKEPSK